MAKLSKRIKQMLSTEALLEMKSNSHLRSLVYEVRKYQSSEEKQRRNQ